MNNVADANLCPIAQPNQYLDFYASSPEFVGEIRFREFAKLVI